MIGPESIRWFGATASPGVARAKESAERAVALDAGSTKEVGSKLVRSDESSRLAKDGTQCSRSQFPMQREGQDLPGPVGQLTS